MTIFAGIVARAPSVVVPDAVREGLKREVSRFRNDFVTEVAGKGFHFVKVDIGAFGSAGILDDERQLALLAGEPLLVDEHRGSPVSRENDLACLQQAMQSGDWSVPERASGTFCAAFFDKESGKLTLLADHFGVRPIYYWVGDEYVVFSTALRVLEALPIVPKRTDTAGLMEYAAFHFSLADRTPFADIKTIREAEAVTVTTQGVVAHRYRWWPNLQGFSGSLHEGAELAHVEFANAVRRRLGRDRTVAAFLSGGLDSRAIVGCLCEQGVTVHTANCSRPNTQDEVFGQMIAEALGTRHQQIGQRPNAVADWLAGVAASDQAPEHPNMIWGGDGGSVGLGHVYLTEKLMALMREGKTETAAEQFLCHNRLGLTLGALHPEAAARLAELPKAGIVAELERLAECPDPGRRMHLFLMFNDQRRHMAEHFENIDMKRIELQLPFFDARFMAVILSLPIDRCLYHRFYLEWLGQFSPAVTSVPWQAYPGHLPCPIPAPPGVRLQWDAETGDAAKRLRREEVRRYWSLARGGGRASDGLINRRKMFAAVLLTYFGIQDYSYALQFASSVLRYANQCGDNGGAT